MLSKEDGWTHVRRRKAPVSREAKNDETSYFVSNIPNGATKEEFRKTFSRFGTITDIYFGGRKGKNGKNYGFIRFTGVHDIKDLETKLNGTKCRSNTQEVNIARHSRMERRPSNYQVNKTTLPTSRQGRGHSSSAAAAPAFVGRRTYAEVTGTNNQKLNGLPKNNNHVEETLPVRLNIDQKMDSKKHAYWGSSLN
ncbi:unnamed protein product [Lactuca virosa]|uniref:RRM domain-containing protein n=1 Tax=Lactuca virosa TaxID=75947 RepID=A0AAU9MGJ4_9ASTR|nr:unnamed protein product [Lactuca virosa]